MGNFDYEFEYSTSGKMILGFTDSGWGKYNIYHIIAALASMGATDPFGNELGHEYHNGPVKMWMFIIDGRLWVVDESDIQDMNNPETCVALLTYDGEWAEMMMDIALTSN